MDSEMSKTVLGETLTTEIGSRGSYAAANTHNEVRKELTKADADLLSDTLNRTLIKWDVQLNLPDAKPPRLWRNFEVAGLGYWRGVSSQSGKIPRSQAFQETALWLWAPEKLYW
jgi:Protein of unknown function (DUF935)